MNCPWHDFSDPSLFVQSMTHSSFLHENADHEVSLDNQRLEFLGDSVLGLIITKKLMRVHKKLAEGQLSKLRSYIVNESSLFVFARTLKLDEYLYLGKGERKLVLSKPSLMADAFEALIGAIYLDANLKAAEDFVISAIESTGRDYFSLDNLTHFDPKTKLQEYCLKKYQEPPTYLSYEVDGDKQKEYVVTLVIDNHELVSTKMNSKKKAQAYLADICLSQNLLNITKA